MLDNEFFTWLVDTLWEMISYLENGNHTTNYCTYPLRSEPLYFGVPSLKILPGTNQQYSGRVSWAQTHPLWVVVADFSCILTWQKTRNLSGTSFIKALKRASPSWPNHPQSLHPLLPLSLGLGFQYIRFRRIQIFKP